MQGFDQLMVAMTPEHKLQRFSATAWTRAIYVGLSNESVRALLEQGWLEKRQSPPPYDGYKGNTATEYRVTPAGQSHLAEQRVAKD